MIEDGDARQQILTELEALRKEVYNIKIKNYSIVGIGALVVVTGIAFGVLIPAIVPGIAILIYGFVMLSKAGPKETQYRYSYKHSLVAYALKTIDESLKIDSAQALSVEAFISSRLLPKHQTDIRAKIRYTASPEKRNSVSQKYMQNTKQLLKLRMASA